MSTRQPRRTRRRTSATSLPLGPLGADTDSAQDAPAVAPVATRAARRSSFSGLREHHVNRDYSYVKSDLMTVSAVGAVVVVFILAMSFLL